MNEPPENSDPFGWARRFRPLARIALGPDGPRENGRRWIRRGLWVVSLAHFLLVVAGLLWMRARGEQHWITATLLFVLPFYWVLPLVFLTPLSLWYCRWACGWHVAAVVFILVFFLPSRPSRPTWSGGTSFRLVDNNLGQRRIETLFALVREVQPDIVVLQEVSPELGSTLRRDGTLGRYFAQHAEFVLASRFPIVRSGLLDRPKFKETPVAAWFELDHAGQSLVIYNVHLPTPRSDFYLLRGNGFIKGLLRGGGIYSSRVRQVYRQMLAQRVAVAEELARRLATEKRPFLVVGDFNAPGPGYVRRLFSSRWTDVFAAVGYGYGLTFPGVTHNPMSLFGPWLRLDYLFASAEIRPLECWVEPGEPAQHRAIVARLEMRAAGSSRPAPLIP